MTGSPDFADGIVRSAGTPAIALDNERSRRTLERMPSTDRTEREGVLAVGLAAEQAGWAFRELPRPDRGVDAHVEGRTDGMPDGRLLALQIKSGPSHFRNERPGGWRYYLEPDHVEYWRGYSIPLLLVLYDPRTQTAYWQLVNPDTTRETGSGYAVDIPRSNVFDSGCGRDLEKLAAAVHAGESNEGLRDRRIALDLPWIWMLDAGDRLFLEAEERLDPQDGRCVLRLVADTDSTESTVQGTWPWTFLSGNEFAADLASLFPWADKKIDTARYRLAAAADFAVEHGVWNQDEDAYDYAADFETWFAERFGSGLAPYARSEDGTIAFWRLELTLNAAGADALKTDRDEMFAEAHAEWDGLGITTSDRAAGYYTIEGVDATYSRHQWLEMLVFVCDDGDDQVRETLLLEPRLFTSEGNPIPRVAEQILRHARGVTATEGLIRAFLIRFAADFDAPDGIPVIPMATITNWLADLESIAESES